MLGVISIYSRGVVVCRHVTTNTSVQTKEWRMINLSMTDVVLFLVVNGLSEVLMSKGFGERLRVCHDGGLDSNIMDRCYISMCGNNGCNGSNVGGSSDMTDGSDRSDLYDGILREKRTFVMGEVLGDVASVCWCDFDDRLLMFVKRSVWVVDSCSYGSESCNNESSHDVVLNYYNRLTYVSLN